MSDNHTVKFDFWAGFNANFILTILDDVKWRDGGCKIVQYMFKLSGALVKDNELLDEAARKTFVANANTAAGLLSTARRCFRFIRWLRNVKEIPGNLSSAPTTTVMALKAASLGGGLLSCICEDITTLGRLKVISDETADKFVWAGNAGWFAESFFSLLLQIKTLQFDIAAFKMAKANYKLISSKKDTATVSDMKAAAMSVFQAYVRLHFSKIAFVKWACETAAAAHDLGYHNYSKVAYASSLTSALVSTYAQGAKFWK